MKIIFIEPLISTNTMGGAQKSLLHLMLGLKKKKYDVVLAIPGDSDLTKKAKEANIQVEKYFLPKLLSTRITYKKYRFFNLFFAIINIFFLVVASISLSRISVKNRVNIIHSNQALVSITAGLVALFMNAKCVWHIRENPSKHVRAYVLKIYGIISYLLSDVIIVNSKYTAKIYNNTLASKKIKIVPIGVRDIYMKFYQSGPLKKYVTNKKSSDKVISTFGRVIFSKGYLSLLKATKILEKKGFRFNLNIYGNYNGYDSYYKSLIEFVKEKSLSSNVLFLGYRDNVEKNIYASDLVVAPSIEPESFGRTLIESMSARTPVIASDLGAHAELIIDNVDGFLFEPNNEIQLAEKIMMVFNQQKLTDKIVIRAHEKCKKYFSIEKYTNSIESIYRNLN
jgi:glycosyltransferase involved in cell wall biosynthesis